MASGTGMQNIRYDTHQKQNIDGTGDEGVAIVNVHVHVIGLRLRRDT